MATITYELSRQRKDGTRKVSMVLSHKGNRRRLPFNLRVGVQDISRNGRITSKKLQKTIDDRRKEYSDRLYELDMSYNDTDIDWIYAALTQDTKNIDFFEFTKTWMDKSNTKSRKNYVCMLNALTRYTNSNSLPFSSIDYRFLDGFSTFLSNHPRAQSLYLVEMRHMFNEAIMKCNREGMNVIADNPFKYFKIPRYCANTRDRVVSEEVLAKVFNFKGTGRIGMARDCYVLSFCLMGMNSIDLYECTEFRDGILSYDRAKTRDRRKDHAHIEIEVPELVKPLLEKYKGDKRLFDFYARYTTASNFNKHINKGLEIMARKLGIPKFDFYSARHTWASIARNKLGIDKYTIHEALNHVSELDMTDIYIQRDYSNINKVNKDVVGYVTRLMDNKRP